MKLERYGRPNPNLTYNLQPQVDVRKYCLERIDYLLGYLQNHRPQILARFVRNHLERLRPLVKLAQFADKDVELLALLTHYPYLQYQIDLAKLYLNFYLQVIGMTEQQFWASEALVIPYRAFMHSVFRFEYLQMLALVDTAGKQEAIELFRQYRDLYNIEHEADIPSYATLSALRADLIKAAQSGRLGRVRTISEIENGRFIYRCENCEKIELIIDLPVEDPELLETVVCYGDFQLTILYNGDFTLTRTHTIAAGHPYCDMVYHDKRLAARVEHPTEAFWDGLDAHLDDKK